MSLQTYSTEILGLADELAESLQAEEVDALRELLLESGPKLAVARWQSWRRLHAADVERFAGSSPSARTKRKLSYSDRLLLTLGAYQCCVEAGNLLHRAGQLRVGGSYREMAAWAGQQYRRLVDEDNREPPMWPWGYPNPFAAEDWD